MHNTDWYKLAKEKCFSCKKGNVVNKDGKVVGDLKRKRYNKFEKVFVVSHGTRRKRILVSKFIEYTKFGNKIFEERILNTKANKSDVKYFKCRLRQIEKEYGRGIIVKVIKDYNDGMSQKDISFKYNISSRKIYSILNVEYTNILPIKPISKREWYEINWKSKMVKN